MNWGYKILIVILLFIGGMFYMVYVAMQQNNEMLDDNYYEREKQFQTLIDAKSRLISISDQRMLTQTDEFVVLSIPAAICSPIKDAKMSWIRRDNMNADQEIAIVPNDSCQMLLPKENFDKGMYMVRISWEYGGELYFNEEDFFVNK